MGKRNRKTSLREAATVRCGYGNHAWGPLRGGLLAGLFLLAAVTPNGSAQSMEVVARAASVSGRSLLYAGGGGTLALTPGYVLNPGDRIDTRGGGRVVIDLSDGSMVVVQPESIVVLKDFRQASSLRELFDITLGLVRVKINHYGGRPNPYRMNSPTASIAVRGTEFSIEVAPEGDTQVVVYEGAVEVTSLTDPGRRTLIDAGRGVLVRPGQDFRFLVPPPSRPGDFGDRNDAGDREHRQQPMANAVPPLAQPVPHAEDHRSQQASHGERDDDPSPRGSASTYDRYIASLSDIAQIPFLFRYNAFAERHLDSLENPAVAAGFTSGEGRLFLLPSFNGVRGLQEYQAAFGPGGTQPAGYSFSPQLSMFSPVGKSGFVVGGSISASRVGDSGFAAMPVSDPSALQSEGATALQTAGSSTTTFYSGALLAARRFGHSSVGLEVESLRGTGSLLTTLTQTGTTTAAGSESEDDESEAPGTPSSSTEQIDSASRVTQTRFTAGFSRDLSKTTSLGLFYRYALISATDADRSHTIHGTSIGLNSTGTDGHSYELGARLRGLITPRLSYGAAAAWLGVSLGNSLTRIDAVDSHGRDRAQRGSLAVGLGYALNRRTVLSFDVAGGAARTQASRTENSTGHLLQNGNVASRFVSVHAAVQADLTRHLFASASLLGVWRSQDLKVDLFADRFGSAALVVDSFFPLAPGSYPSSHRFSDFGLGWRFSQNLFLQYVCSTDYGASPVSHTLMLRYTFRLRRE